MDAQQALSPPSVPRRPFGGHFDPSRPSRTQSDTANRKVDREDSEEKCVFQRRLSLPMTSVQNPITAPYPIRKPNFKIQLPSFSVSPVSATANAIYASHTTSISIDPKHLSTFIPRPLTPPDDNVVIEFATGAEGSAKPDDSEIPPSQDSSSFPTSTSKNLHPADRSATSMQSQGTVGGSAGLPPRGPVAVYNAVISLAVSSATSSLKSSRTIKLVHQALPYPEPLEDASSGVSVYGPLITALQSDHTLQAQFLHVVHALPEKCPTNVMPTSPPVTPGSMARPSSQLGYFDHRPVISNTRFVADPYQPPKGTPMPPLTSGGLVVPPGEISISLYERIIPPSAEDEATEFFKTFGKSSLVDRIQELAPDGTLILAYPTQKGGQAFETQYLGPVLEPVLRNLISKSALSQHLAKRIGTMAAVAKLKSFESMKRQLQTLLSLMNRDQAGDAKTPFSAIHASTANVQITKKMWEKWWVHQEKPRIDNLLLESYGSGKALPNNANLTAAGLARELVEGLEKRGYGSDEHSGVGNGIEIGLFVIKRAAEST